MGFRTFTTVGELLWYCSPVCGSPTRQIWNLILSWLHPSYVIAAVSSLSLGVGYLSSVGSSILLSMVVQQLVAIFGALAGEDEPTSFYSIILNQKPPITSLKLFALYSVPCIWSSLEYYRCWKCRTIKDIFVNFIILLESNLWQFYLRGPSLQKSICP